jgi:hypothetical protein
MRGFTCIKALYPFIKWDRNKDPTEIKGHHGNHE